MSWDISNVTWLSRHLNDKVLRHVLRQCHLTFEWQCHLTFEWQCHLTFEWQCHLTFEWQCLETCHLTFQISQDIVMKCFRMSSAIRVWHCLKDIECLKTRHCHEMFQNVLRHVLRHFKCLKTLSWNASDASECLKTMHQHVLRILGSSDLSVFKRSIRYIYGVATVSRSDKIIGLFCKRAL